MTQKTYFVPDMHCSNCAMRLEALEDTLQGVKNIKASYHRQHMEVEFDETIITEAEILSAVQTLGYHPE